MTVTEHVQALLKALEGKVTFDEIGNPTYLVADEKKYDLYLTLLENPDAFYWWDPRKLSPAAAGARLGMTKAEFLHWFDFAVQTHPDNWDIALQDMQAECFGLTPEEMSMTYLPELVLQGEITLNELTEVEREVVKKLTGISDDFRAEPNSDRK